MEEDHFWSVFFPRHHSGQGLRVENSVSIQFEASRDCTFKSM